MKSKLDRWDVRATDRIEMGDSEGKEIRKPSGKAALRFFRCSATRDAKTEQKIVES